MSNQNELIKAAAYRVRSGDYSGIKGINDRSLMPGIDMRLLAQAWLNEHPAEDDEPVTEERLCQAGLRIVIGRSFPLTANLSIWRSGTQGWGLYFDGGFGDGFSYYDTNTDEERVGVIRIADIPNMKALRRVFNLVQS